MGLALAKPIAPPTNSLQRLSAEAKKLGKPKNPAHNTPMDAPNATELLTRYSRADISATELRRALGGITYADIIIELAKRNLPLPRASQAGREAQIATARAWLFPPAE